MSKQVAIIPLERIKRIAIILGQGKSLTQIKGSADYVINGGFYSMTTGKAVGHLKVDGKVLSKEAWNCWGFRWDHGADIRMDVVPDSGGANYISGTGLLTRDLGKDSKLSYPGEQGGVRGRSAIGISGDSLVLYCTGDGTKDGKNPEGVRDELVSLGCDRAIMLDSGGSSQCSFPDGNINSIRRVHNYIAVWLNSEESSGSEDDMGKKVVLDPGHGVETAGKRSPDGKYFEHEFNLDMAKRIKKHLERHGVSVTLTRTTEKDVTLAKRVQIANNISGLDLFVSLHSNASGNGSVWTDPDGFGIYTSAAGATAGRNKAANAILARAKSAGINIWGGGLFHNVELYVLKNTVAAACLIEHGFHTNKAETELLKSDAYRAKLAVVDAKGILDYLGIAWKEEVTENKESGFVCPHCGKPLQIVKG